MILLGFRYYLQDFRPSNFSPWKKIRLLTFAVKFSEEEIKNFYLEYTNINQDCVVIIEGNKEHFYPILSKRDLIYQSLIDISSDMVKNSFEKMKQENYIGVHVRRGDFKIVNQMIPIDWYSFIVILMNSLNVFSKHKREAKFDPSLQI